jgi:hypothetical protein
MPKKAKEPKFKVGGRVEYKLVRCSINLEITKGMVGTVKGYCSLGLVVVEWDKSTAMGHSQEGSKPGHAWNVFEKEIELTKKPKEPKTMQVMSTTKKPGTTHGKPTAKGLRAPAKPTTKPKYPAARVQLEIKTSAKHPGKMTKAELQTVVDDYRIQFNNLAADHCIAGTKLDRALVDLKEAKAKIKELTKGTEVSK